MDEAFLALLDKKNFAYITVKEICEAAGVNRSTFYLHYETMADLLSESVSHMNEQFLAHMKKDTDAFLTKMRDCPMDDKSYERMRRHVFMPILDRYGVPEWDRPYLMAFYIHGLMAIISEWLKNDCVDSIADIVNVIQRCVKRRKEEI